MDRRIDGVRIVTALVRIGMLLGAGAVAPACRPASDATFSQTQVARLLYTKADTGIALRAVVLRDTIPVGDQGPVEVAYAIVNGPRPTSFENNPGRYQIVVTGPDSQPATSLGGSGPVSGGTERYHVPLPAGAALVQRQDLRCVNDAAYSPIPIVPSKDECLAMYALAAPGPYHVVVDYFGPEQVRQDVAGKKLPSGPGLHLSDTTNFVVKGP